MSTKRVSKLIVISFVAATCLTLTGHSEDKPKFDVDPLKVEDLAMLLGIAKSGFRVHLPEERHVRLVAEITVNGKTRKEFAALKEPVRELRMAAYTENEPSTSAFRRLTFTIESDKGASSRRHVNDFRRADMRNRSTSLDNGTVTYSYSFWSDPGTPLVKPKELGGVKIYLETSVEPFVAKTDDAAPKK